MKIFVFDTETTGFIKKEEKDLSLQPKVIQFAGILGELNGNNFKELRRINIFINPEMPIPYGSSLVNHIYDVDVKDKPNFASQKDEILSFLNEADLVIGHNIEYDDEILKLEFLRLGESHLYNPKKLFCTMKTTVDFCGIQGNGARFKYPKLGELHKKLFGEYFTGAHDAIVDVEATLKCFLELVKIGEIKLESEDENLILSLF